MQKILVIGSGGREHAICEAFRKSSTNPKIYCAEGNAGIAEIAECVALKPTEIDKLADFAQENNIDLTFVGGETALALGIADEFQKRNLKIIGVSRQAAQLEASKAFAKNFMARHHIPTAVFATANSAESAIDILESGRFGDQEAPVVIKADGLAAGKGVIVAGNRSEAKQAVQEISSGNSVNREAAQTIVLEECLVGREVSLIVFTDGQNFLEMPPARDHKRIGEGDTGANTGGMGVITDAHLLTADHRREIVEGIINPTLKGAAEEGFPISGILFFGLMLTANGIKVLEYNVRFGDPETQAILTRLETDLVEICQSVIDRKLDSISLRWTPGASACVILAAENYPQKPKTGDEISGLAEASRVEDVKIYHSGTKFGEHREFLTAGGRVLAVTATGSDVEESLMRAYQAVELINWDGMQYRRDIGK